MTLGTEPMGIIHAAVHTRRRQQGELSMDQLGDAWQEQLQAMFGDGLELTPEHRSWWSYIEPFVHTPGYVYAYAFGNLLALSLYRRYQEAGEPFVITGESEPTLRPRNAGVFRHVVPAAMSFARTRRGAAHGPGTARPEARLTDA